MFKHHFSHKSWLAFLLVLLMFLIACSDDDTPAQIQTPTPPPAQQEKSIVLLFENDVHCNVSGYVKFAGYRDAIVAADTAYVACTSSGDFSQGSVEGTLSKGEYIVDLMNLVGYDAVGLGNHEFDYGADQMLRLTSMLKAPVTCANLIDLRTGKLVHSPYVIKQLGNRKVAFIGVLTPSAQLSNSYSFSDPDSGKFIYDLQDSRVYELVQNAADDARAAGANYVVVLSHLGEYKEKDVVTYSIPLIQKTHGIDAVFDGHQHTTVPGKWINNSEGKPVLRLETGTKMKNVGKLVITADGKLQPELVPTDNMNYTNAAVSAKVDEIAKEMDDRVGKVIAHTDFTLHVDGEYGLETIRCIETNLGDLCTDIQREVAGAQICLINGGGIRTNIEAGDVTVRSIINVLPMSNWLCILKATGQQIVDALEIGSKTCPAVNGSFLQCSGIKYTVDTRIANSLEVSDDNLLTVTGERRVKNVQVLQADGTYAPIDLNAKYTLATNSFVGYAGGTIRVLRPAERLEDGVRTDTDITIAYFSEHFKNGVPSIYREPQGRITVIK